jgi:metal-responsive CopG/Arc/MetJ family transcriptional regulator
MMMPAKLSVSLPSDVLAILDEMRGEEPRSTALAAIVRAWSQRSADAARGKQSPHQPCAWCGREGLR